MCRHNVCSSVNINNNSVNNTINSVNNTIDSVNNTIDSVNNTIGSVNNTIGNKIKEVPYKCLDCYRIFKNKYNLKNHNKCCKGIKTPHECQYCHKIYKQQQHKSRHEKRCQEEYNKMQEKEHIGSQIINNTTNNTTNNITNNTMINNNLTINLVAFPKEKNRLVPFLSDHLDAKAIANMFGGPMMVMDCFKQYSEAIFQRPENNIIIKKNLRNAYSKVHIGDNNWEMFLDKEILPIITDSITAEAAHQLEFSGAEELLSKKRYLACELLFNSILSPDNEAYKNMFKEAYEKIKFVILNRSYKEKLNGNNVN